MCVCLSFVSYSQAQDKNGEALEVDYDFFDEHLWPALALRVPAFEGLKVSRSGPPKSGSGYTGSVCS